jgi:hypothetical protein
MGFMDALLGKRKLKAPAPDRLFAISTADFQQNVSEMEEVLRGTGEETGTELETSDDSYGYRWIILRDPDIEDLTVGINAVSDALAVGGYSDRVLAAVFAFDDSNGKPIYFIYNYKRGKWYPFVPAGGEQQRSNERELQLKAQVASELPIEPELERWFPLWGIPI